MEATGPHPPLGRVRRLLGGAGRQEGSSLLSSIGEIVLIVAAAFVLALLIQHFLVKPFGIPSESMEPTLLKGDRVLVNRLAYRFGEPQRGDIVVFRPPMGNEDYIKRIVAVGGDTVAVHDGRLYVNGEPQSEPYIKEQQLLGQFEEVEVPEGSCFMMGDNRNNSGDSRVFGSVKKSAVVGKAFLIYWPLSHLGRP
ncbi:MAG: signal peptidase I [Actinobacteria bacterium]|nr:signal peptidase I [Actinomycetota bacterium]